jgi:hypothetical protein
MDTLMPSTKSVNCVPGLLPRVGIQLYGSIHWLLLALSSTVGIVDAINPMLIKAIKATKIAAAFGDFFPVR